MKMKMRLLVLLPVFHPPYQRAFFPCCNTCWLPDTVITASLTRSPHWPEFGLPPTDISLAPSLDAMQAPKRRKVDDWLPVSISLRKGTNTTPTDEPVHEHEGADLARFGTSPLLSLIHI